jgi:hypothetical protein
MKIGNAGLMYPTGAELASVALQEVVIAVDW